MSRFPSNRHAIWLLLLLAGPTVAAEPKPAIPLKHAHAHNDYQHKRPLFDALERGFCSVEADIYLVGGELLVGHTPLDLRTERTLQKLYLEPLRARIKANGGHVYPGGATVFLLIDVKTDAAKTYAVLSKVLAEYSDILSVSRKGKFTANAVTAVISGNRDVETIQGAEVRYAGIDGRLDDLGSTAAADVMPWISASWGAEFRWKGEGPIPEAEGRKLRAYVEKAHKEGRLVRFWATPEKPAVWKELRAAGVDLLNTDRLDDLQRFLLDEARAELRK